MNTHHLRYVAIVLALGLAACAKPSAVTPSPDVRLTAAEIEGETHGGAGTGTSGLNGIETIALEGNADGTGQYVIVIKVPPHTRIDAHSHPDDRSATVVSGDWYFGYGEQFSETALKKLPPGSFYTEPANRMHFAQTGDTTAIVHITGRAPSGTTWSEKSKP